MSGRIPATRPMRVLAADDDGQVLELISAILTAAGHEVLCAGSGEDCLRRVAENPPDVILLDVRMPGLGGIATAARLAQSEETKNIPIVMITGLLNESERVKALKAGAVDFLLKPVKPEELVAKVISLGRLKTYHDQGRSERAALLKEVEGKTGQLAAALESFARFVPKEFLHCLSKKSIVEVELGDNVRMEMAILFADIRSFTTLSERMSPEDNFRFLNSYLGRMNPFIWENEGFIDKYIGDAIMALFPTGSGAALNAAIAMLSYLPEYNTQRARFGYEPIHIGIGLNAGPVMLGIIGQERFIQGTVISDAVNLGSRLEELTKVYGVSLIVSNHVLFGLKDPTRYHYRFLDRVKVKGKRETVPVYEVFDADSSEQMQMKLTIREQFERGVYEYHAGRFAAAAELFEGIPTGQKPDRPVLIYRARCRRSLALGAAELAATD